MNVNVVRNCDMQRSCMQLKIPSKIDTCKTPHYLEYKKCALLFLLSLIVKSFDCSSSAIAILILSPFALQVHLKAVEVVSLAPLSLLLCLLLFALGTLSQRSQSQGKLVSKPIG